MDEDLKNFECELRRLQPVAPSRPLLTRLERELGNREETSLPALPGPNPRASVRWVWFATIPAAAALAVLLSRNAPPAPRSDRASAISAPVATASEGFKPITAENVLYSARDEGLVVLDDGTPARRERLQFVDTITWKNPRTNASLRWTVPREEVRVVPISFQ